MEHIDICTKYKVLHSTAVSLSFLPSFLSLPPVSVCPAGPGLLYTVTTGHQVCMKCPPNTVIPHVAMYLDTSGTDWTLVSGETHFIAIGEVNIPEFALVCKPCLINCTFVDEFHGILVE